MSKSSKMNRAKPNWLYDVNDEKSSDENFSGDAEVKDVKFFDGPYRGNGQLGRAWDYDEKKVKVD